MTRVFLKIYRVIGGVVGKDASCEVIKFFIHVSLYVVLADPGVVVPERR